MASQESNIDNRFEICGKPTVCTDNHCYRSELVTGIINHVSYFVSYQYISLYSKSLHVGLTLIANIY